MNLAFVNLAESRDGVAQAELAQGEAHFARTVKLLKIESFGRTFRFQIVIRFGRVHVGVCRSHLERRFLQGVRNQLELAHDTRVYLLDVENHHAVLVRAADDNPVERVGERLVRRRNQLLEKEVVNFVVLFGFEHRILTVELQVAWLHENAAFACGAVGARQGACNHLLRSARKAVYIPEFLDGKVLDSELVFVVEHGERFAVGGVSFTGVTRNLVCNGLFKEHATNLEKYGPFYSGALFQLGIRTE